MNKQELFQYITANPVSYMATSADNVPHVRGMETYRADENGLIFYTSYNKNVCKQILANPQVELCYFAKAMQVRVSGIMEELKDNVLKQEIVDNRDYLQGWVEEAGLDALALFRLIPAEASYWPMDTMPDEVIPIEL
ncbi:MAG: pyridoxamine 5'-phosphate oxidase family protein [Dehalococcoidales bacterium]|nr:pyridoxamine 5'-phosphate oxidase family protein [Dehalococcoidales bacterium]